MPGPSRLWSSFSATAAYRSFVETSVNEIFGAFRSSSSKFCHASISQNRPIAGTTLISRILSLTREETLSSEVVQRRAHRISFSHLASQTNSDLYRPSSYHPSSSCVETGSVCRGFRFASSTSYAARHPCREKQEGKGNVRVRSFGKSKSKSSQAGAVVARRGRPAFRGALSSIKGLQSEQGRGNLGPRVVRGDAKKGSVLSPLRKNALKSTRIKFKDRPADEGLKLKRKRKRIKPRPRDVTYKRGLDSDSLNMGGGMAERASTLEEPPSLNAQFRQIQPSRELLEFIEENCLGRRRLGVWRDRGYDPKRTAPLDDLPDGKTKRNPIQETVFKHKLTFIAAAKQVPSLPALQYPEVAFAGRSNVGKSSLVNALSRRWGTARTSEKPGLTQSINFFTLGSRLCLVDLPGYGFAYAKEEKKEDWEELVKYYVQTRENLKRVCLLVDAKWGLKPRDEELLHLMESAGTPFQVVLTKTDVLPHMDLARRATQILEVLENHRCLIRPLMMVSSKTGAGIQLFRASLARIALSQPRFLQEDSP
ncbi:unnamed protein product [Calypogeia fissa]